MSLVNNLVQQKPPNATADKANALARLSSSPDLKFIHRKKIQKLSMTNMYPGELHANIVSK